MIAESSSGHAFGGLIRYLLHGRSGEEHSRVDWTMSRNLALDNPEHAASLMRATAAQNHRVEQPVYHLIVSFDPSDRPSPALMRQVMDRLLDDLRLNEHQALLVAHRDRAHSHVHVVINRVHPETTRAWDRWQDHTRLERTLRTVERELGLREVDGHLHQLEGQRAPDRQDRHRDRHIQHEPDAKRPHLGAESMARVHEAARRIYDADLPSHLDRLEFECERQRATHSAQYERFGRAQQTLQDASRKLYNAFADVFERPEAAREKFEDVLYADGPGAAIRRLRHDPASYVELRSHDRRRLFGLGHASDDSIARAHLPTAIAAARDHAAAVAQSRAALREIEPGITRIASDLSIRAESEHAAWEARFERELARIRNAREQLPEDDLLRQRARHHARRLRPAELTRLHSLVRGAAATLTIALHSRTVRDIAMGRDLAE